MAQGSTVTFPCPVPTPFLPLICPRVNWDKIKSNSRQLCSFQMYLGLIDKSQYNEVKYSKVEDIGEEDGEQEEAVHEPGQKPPAPTAERKWKSVRL